MSDILHISNIEHHLGLSFIVLAFISLFYQKFFTPFNISNADFYIVKNI
jgi:hypothetical protein